MQSLVLISLFAPLLGAIVAGLFAFRPKVLFVGIFTSIMILVSFVASLNLLFHIFETSSAVRVELLDWIVLGNLYIPFGFVVDEISVIMMIVITLVSSMVHIHSIGYMKHDIGFNRYFSFLSLFVFSMMILVMSDNFAGLFIGWEGVGLCSWLLIGFWYYKDDKKPSSDIYNSPYSTLSPHSSISPSYASNEAFIMNRVADLAILIGIFLIFWNFGTLQYQDVFSQLNIVSHEMLIIIASLLFIGAMGKSAQFPFNQWLANAMEGPTPVSALIHAATMVTAGVYLVIRANEIFVIVPEVGTLIAYLGTFVAFGAALLALVATNIKKIIAFSTLSQLGYMFVAAGLGAYWVALFHLATHAFFKSVLFLGAGNVMHATNNEIDIKKMGGLHKYMKATSIIMTIASVALAGIYPLSGFFSKDLILEVAFGSHAYVIWAMLWITAGITAFYSFRLIMYVFHGKDSFKDKEIKPKETYPFVIAAMTPLAILAIVGGWFKDSFESFATKILPPLDIHLSETTFYILIAITSAISIFGILLAVFKYKKDGSYFSNKFKEKFFYKIFANQYYIPHFLEKVIIKPYIKMSTFSFKEIDLKIIDATVDGVGKLTYKLGKEARLMQSGNLSTLLKVIVYGFVIILAIAVAFGMGE